MMGFRFFMFTKPVDTEEVPDYNLIIKQPMDLETMMTKIDMNCYLCAREFLDDIDLICRNALEYNPDRSVAESGSNLSEILAGQGKQSYETCARVSPLQKQLLILCYNLRFFFSDTVFFYTDYIHIVCFHVSLRDRPSLGILKR